MPKRTTITVALSVEDLALLDGSARADERYTGASRDGQVNRSAVLRRLLRAGAAWQRIQDQDPSLAPGLLGLHHSKETGEQLPTDRLPLTTSGRTS